MRSCGELVSRAHARNERRSPRPVARLWPRRWTSYRRAAMTTAVGYVRVSTLDQAREGFSISAQRRRIASYCDAQGWSLDGLYADEGVTGATIERPEFQRMLDHVLASGVDRIVFVKLDRLGRCAWRVGELRERLEASGVGLVSITEALDTSTPAGRLFWSMLAAFAEFERDMLRERVAAGFDEKASRGTGWIRGRTPFGYRAKPDGLVIDAAEATVVRFIFRLASQGLDNGTIARELVRRQLRRPAGVDWTSQSVRRVVRRSIYRGDYRSGGHAVRVDAIVSRRAWRRANAR